VKCGSLKDRNKKEEFLEELSEEYEEIREEHYDSLKVNSLFDTLFCAVWVALQVVAAFQIYRVSFVIVLLPVL